MEQRGEAEDPRRDQARFLQRPREWRRDVRLLGEDGAEPDRRNRQQATRPAGRAEVGPQAEGQKTESGEAGRQVGHHAYRWQAGEDQLHLHGGPATIDDDRLGVPHARPRPGRQRLRVPSIDAVDAREAVTDPETGAVGGPTLDHLDDHAVVTASVPAVHLFPHLQGPKHVQQPYHGRCCDNGPPERLGSDLARGHALSLVPGARLFCVSCFGVP